MPTRNPALANLVREPGQQLEFSPIKVAAKIERSFQRIDRWKSRQTQPLLLTLKKQDSDGLNRTAINRTVIAMQPCPQSTASGEVGRI